MNTHITKIITAVALAALVLPAAASAEITAGVKTNVRTAAPTHASSTSGRVQIATSTAAMREGQTVTNQATQVQKTADLMAAMSLKLSLRVASSTATSSDIAAANAALADLNAQVADAQVQATAAFGHVASATAAGSSKTNTNNELKKARADILVAHKDVDTARKDITKVMQALGVVMPQSEVHATSTKPAAIPR